MIKKASNFILAENILGYVNTTVQYTCIQVTTDISGHLCFQTENNDLNKASP